MMLKNKYFGMVDLYGRSPRYTLLHIECFDWCVVLFCAFLCFSKFAQWPQTNIPIGKSCANIFPRLEFLFGYIISYVLIVKTQNHTNSILLFLMRRVFLEKGH